MRRSTHPVTVALLCLVAALGAPVAAAGQESTAARATDPLPPTPDLVDEDAWDHLSSLPGDFASDAWASATAPFRLRGRDAWAFAGVLAATGVLFAFDGEIQAEVRRHRDAPLAEATVDVAEFVEPFALMSNTNAFWAGGIVLGSVTGWDRLRIVTEQLLFSHWIASILRKGIGHPIGRLRPEQSPEDPYAFDSMFGTSFPSGHASTAAQVAAVFSHHIDRWPATVILHALAGAVVYQRAASEKHWASDSFLGAAWGWGVAQVVIGRREAGRTDFVPIFEPETRMVGVSIPVGF